MLAPFSRIILEIPPFFRLLRLSQINVLLPITYSKKSNFLQHDLGLWNLNGKSWNILKFFFCFFFKGGGTFLQFQLFKSMLSYLNYIFLLYLNIFIYICFSLLSRIQGCNEQATFTKYILLYMYLNYFMIMIQYV